MLEEHLFVCATLGHPLRVSFKQSLTEPSLAFELPTIPNAIILLHRLSSIPLFVYIQWRFTVPKQRDCACSMPLVNKYASTFPRFNWAIMVSWTRTAMSYWPGYSLGGKQATPWLTTYRYRDSIWYQDVANVFAHKNRNLAFMFWSYCCIVIAWFVSSPYRLFARDYGLHLSIF